MQRRMAFVVGAGVAVLLLAWVASAQPAPLWREVHFDVPSPDLRPPPSTILGGSPPPATVAPQPIKPVDLSWLTSATLVLLAVALVVAVLYWLSRRDWSRPAGRTTPFTVLPEIAPEELLDAADEFEALIARGSARNAIVACWVRLERAVDEAGLARNPAETAAEMTARVLRAYAVDAASIGMLAALYREARFSTHDMHEGHRRQAQAALGEIRLQLRGGRRAGRGAHAVSDPFASTSRRRRVKTYLLVWAAVVAVPLFGGRLIHVALAALIAAVFTVVWWWLADVGAPAEPADWTAPPKPSLRARGSDPRAGRLQRLIRDVLAGNQAMGSDIVLGQALVEIIDERVLAHHGIDHASDPDRYAAVVGADLAAFANAVAAGRARVQPRQIPALIDRIERL